MPLTGNAKVALSSVTSLWERGEGLDDMDTILSEPQPCSEGRFSPEDAGSAYCDDLDNILLEPQPRYNSGGLSQELAPTELSQDYPSKQSSTFMKLYTSLPRSLAGRGAVAEPSSEVADSRAMVATLVTASIAGAVAGGAVAGPWGMAAGYKGGALVVAAGTAVGGGLAFDKTKKTAQLSEGLDETFADEEPSEMDANCVPLPVSVGASSEDGQNPSVEPTDNSDEDAEIDTSSAGESEAVSSLHIGPDVGAVKETSRLTWAATISSAASSTLTMPATLARGAASGVSQGVSGVASGLSVGVSTVCSGVSTGVVSGCTVVSTGVTTGVTAVSTGAAKMSSGVKTGVSDGVSIVAKTTTTLSEGVCAAWSKGPRA
ncbi:hypothetical protein CYMTET_22681 [Cymbomonas tetramitiformis]|uniref:Uncharacterized protein n=1 Tax=Cymbomonas tetramitiformis TaxID=36881 RepID=A0AAE0FZF3_9CHLO|nr:hypothetical protein CYMTET_22681 [Cymbomonas tetramitiformis]